MALIQPVRLLQLPAVCGADGIQAGRGRGMVSIWRSNAICICTLRRKMAAVVRAVAREERPAVLVLKQNAICWRW